MFDEEFGKLREKLREVEQLQARVAKSQDRTDERITALNNKQAETDDRLNTLIGVVERYFSGNGASPSKRRPKSGGERKPKKGTRR
jgi:hypothetical protein